MSNGTQKTEEPILEIRDLTVSYKGNRRIFRAVNGIDLQVHAGETVGLVGETGAGKTTTALSIMRLLPKYSGKIDGGDIFFQGESLLNKSPMQMQAIRGALISMIFQDPMTSLNPVMTVGDQILESLKIHNYDNLNLTELHQKTDELLEMVGISPERKGEYPHQFSGGMKQRIIIAIALSCQPRLLLADEPTTALDVTIQAQVLELIRELKQKMHTAVLMITHDLGVVAQTCDSVAVMYAGEIIEEGSVEEIFEGKIHHPYTIGLFQSIPRPDTQSKRLRSIPGQMPDPSDLPEGCYFSPRCTHCSEICRTKHPPVTYNSGTHKIKCFLYMGTARIKDKE